MPKKTPEIYPFGHMHMVLYPPGGPGAAWGVYANYDEKCFTRNPPVFSGIIGVKTGDELRKIADAIDIMMSKILMGGT